MVNDDKYAKDVTKTIIQEAKKIGQTASKQLVTDQPVINKDSVFIVHGHDDGLKNEVARFIEKLGLKAMILHEQTSSSMTIIEKLEKYTDVGFAITLYTHCDVGSIKDPVDLKPRARQNVIFEHGYLTGKLGRQNVCALVENNIELPSDISGIVFISYDTAGSWKYQIAKEMKAAGYNIDLNQI